MNKWLLHTATVSLFALLSGVFTSSAYAREAAVPNTGTLQASTLINDWMHNAKASNQIVRVNEDHSSALTEEKQNRSASEDSAPSSVLDSPTASQGDKATTKDAVSEEPDASSFSEEESTPAQTGENQTSIEDQKESEQPIFENHDVASPKNEQKEPVANSIGLDGTYYPFMDMGTNEDAQLLQDTISQGAVAASTHPFSGTDGNTTYFSGANPGVFSNFALNLQPGDIIEVVDGNGNTHTYQMNEKIVTDVFGSMIIPSLEKTVMDIYTHGSGEESIVLQYENGTGLIVWYGAQSAPSATIE